MSLRFVNLLCLIYLSFSSSKRVVCSKLINPTILTINQHKYNTKLLDEITSLIVVTGPAGTGKTMFACKKAVDYLQNTDKKVILTRPVISVEEEQLGFLPGNINNKMMPWVTPLFDYFLEDITREKLNTYINSNKLEICPLAYMRGRTFNNVFIIADEMQNSTPDQMKMLVTRVGKDSRLVVTGDLNQSDLKKFNGLKDLVDKLREIEEDDEIALINLEIVDISRSSLVKKMINLYENN